MFIMETTQNSTLNVFKFLLLIFFFFFFMAFVLLFFVYVGRCVCVYSDAIH